MNAVAYRAPLDREDRELQVGASTRLPPRDAPSPLLAGLHDAVAVAWAMSDLNRGTNRAVMLPEGVPLGGGFY